MPVHSQSILKIFAVYESQNRSETDFIYFSYNILIETIALKLDAHTAAFITLIDSRPTPARPIKHSLVVSLN